MENIALDIILKSRLIVILRGVPTNKILGVGQALYKGGVKAVEVTFSADKSTFDEQTAEKIRLLNKNFGDKMVVGAGTVLSPEQVDIAAEAGAKLIVSPDVNPDVIKRTKKLGLVSVPGAFTATEAMTAHRAGADIIKLFPVGSVSPEYLAALTAPLSHLKFFAVGGVTEKNLPDYLHAGAAGAGISSGIASKSAVANDDYAEIERKARAFAEILQKE